MFHIFGPRFWPLLILLGLVVLFFLLMGVLLLITFFACLLEKQRIRDFVPAMPEELPPASPYFRSMSEYARLLGYQPGGMFGQNRESSMYRVYLGLWLATDQKSLLCIASGKLARVPYKRTFLISRLPDDTSLVTMDAFGSEDISGTRNIEVLMNADLNELTQLHQRRLAMAGVEPLPFSNNRLAELEQWNRTRADRLVAGGFAKYTDDNTWHFTLKGAILHTYKAQLRGLARASAQKERMQIRRPGG
jgi:hypothetical protein